MALFFVATFVHAESNQSSEPAFQQWRTQLDVESVSLMFSTAYPNNPASMFGHTFLKLNSKKNSSKKNSEAQSDLLNYGVGYAADTQGTEDSGFGIGYVLKGLFGGYEGYFSLTPFYTKLNEYVNKESRDLWEYELDLSRDEIDRLVLRLWELRSNNLHFTYYFITKNCSYYILELLDVAKPQWRLTESYQGFKPAYVLPADTVRKIMAIEGSVKAIHFRPSASRKLKARVDSLSRDDRERYEDWKKYGELPKGESSRKALDAVIEDMSMRRFRNSQIQTPEEGAQFRMALLTRAKLGGDSQELDVHSGNRPDLGHHSSSVLVSGLAPHAGFLFRFRWGLHDLLDAEEGYEPHSEMIFMQPEFRYFLKSHRFSFESLRVFDVQSLYPNDFVEKKISWGVRSGWSRLQYLDCENCHAAQVNLRAGFSKAWGIPLFYAQGVFAVDASASLAHSVWAAPGLAVGLLADFSRVRVWSEIETRYDVWGWFRERLLPSAQLGFGVSLSPQWMLRAESKITRRVQENRAWAQDHSFGLQTYF